MKLWLIWVAVFVGYVILNYACVWMSSSPGLLAYFSWGTTFPVVVMATWSAILLPRRRILRNKWILGVLTILAYGSLGILSCWTIWTRMAAV